MKISAIPNYNLINHTKRTERKSQAETTQPSFKSNDAGYMLNGQYMSTRSYMFDVDVDWELLTKTLMQQFKDKNKVNVICLGAGDGSEAYSLAMMLMEREPKRGANNKFFPIYASDRSNKVFEHAAKRGIMNLREGAGEDMDRMFYDYKIYDWDSKYLTYIGKRVPFCTKDVYMEQDDLYGWRSYKINPILQDKVAFSCEKEGLPRFEPGTKLEDMLPQIKDDSNTVIMCRNIFQYLPEESRNKIFEFAKNEMKPGSIFVVGYHDVDLKRLELTENFEKAGFKPVYDLTYMKGFLTPAYRVPTIFKKMTPEEIIEYEAVKKLSKPTIDYREFETYCNNPYIK